MRKTSKKHRLVGWGDDGISEWRSPLADYYSLSIAIDYCEQVGVDFPIKKLISTLIKSGFNIKASRAYSITSTADIFEALLKPYFRVDYERWGGDSPGRSGVYQTAFLQLGHTKELRKILKQADGFIADWLDSTGVNKEYAALMIKTNVSTKPIPFQESKQAGNLQQQWEDELFNQVEIAVKADQKLIRLNYLVFQGVIFYLNRSWFHSLTGSVENVTNRLRGAGFKVVDIEVVSTYVGWIPYYARRNKEELHIGWNEKTIKINCPDEWKDQLEKARKLSSR